MTHAKPLLLDRVNLLAGAVLLLSALIQFNDPDPARWIAIYGLASVACFLPRRFGFGRWLAGGVAVVALLWALTYAPAVSGMRFGELFESMKATTPSIELARELLGLLIVAAWMGVLFTVRYRRPR